MACRIICIKVFSNEEDHHNGEVKENTKRYEFLALNCQALNQDKADIISAEYLQSLNTKIVRLCETWCLLDNVTAVYFENFINVANYCRSQYKGGGVGIWCRKDLKPTPINWPVECVEKDFEICGILVKFNNDSKETIILTCYRTPGSNFTIFCIKIIQVLEYVYKPTRDIIMNGDFNLDVNRDSRDYAILCDMLGSFNMFNYISTPKRGNRILDHVFSNVGVACKVEQNYISDHKTIKIYPYDLYLKNKYANFRLARSFTENNIKAFYEDLEREDFICPI